MKFKKAGILSVFLVLSYGFVNKTDDNNKQEKVFTILGLGDSITQGSASCSYLFPLAKKLSALDYKFSFIGPNKSVFNNDTIRCAGFSGRNAEYLDKLIYDIYSKYPADIVLLHSGHNHFESEYPIPGIIQAHESMIRKMISINPKVKILVAKVIQSGKLPKYSYVKKLNKEIQKMVNRLNLSNVILVDMTSAFDWKIHTIPDMVHPNLTGAEVMAKIWFLKIKSILGQSDNNH